MYVYTNTCVIIFFSIFVTLDTGPIRTSGLELSDANKYMSLKYEPASVPP